MGLDLTRITPDSAPQRENLAEQVVSVNQTNSSVCIFLKK